MNHRPQVTAPNGSISRTFWREHDIRGISGERRAKTASIDVSGSKEVLKALLEEVLKKNGDDPETFHFQSAEEAFLSKIIVESVSQKIDETSKINNEKFDQKFESVSQKIDETSRKFESVSQKIDETSRKSDEKFEKVSRVIKDVCRQNDEKFEEVSRTFDKIQKSVDDNKEILKEKIKQLESMITDTKVQLSVNAVALDDVVKDETPRYETSDHMRFKLPPLDGKSSWSIYLRQFEAIATANN
uniref:Uncharacterized protein LOC114345493 n=1 Tax=Diabrotica virgifera virgifera TaxID=50390 RepID=A0A6P7GRE0_DIAVI